MRTQVKKAESRVFDVQKNNGFPAPGRFHDLCCFCFSAPTSLSPNRSSSHRRASWVFPPIITHLTPFRTISDQNLKNGKKIRIHINSSYRLLNLRHMTTPSVDMVVAVGAGRRLPSPAVALLNRLGEACRVQTNFLCDRNIYIYIYIYIYQPCTYMDFTVGIWERRKLGQIAK